MRTRSCGCGDTRGKNKRRISEKREEAGALGQEPALQRLRFSDSAVTSLCQGAEITRGTRQWRLEGMECFSIGDAPLITLYVTLQRCFSETMFHGTVSEENRYLASRT